MLIRLNEHKMGLDYFLNKIKHVEFEVLLFDNNQQYISHISTLNNYSDNLQILHDYLEGDSRVLIHKLKLKDFNRDYAILQKLPLLDLSGVGYREDYLDFHIVLFEDNTEQRYYGIESPQFVYYNSTDSNTLVNCFSSETHNFSYDSFIYFKDGSTLALDGDFNLRALAKDNSNYIAKGTAKEFLDFTKNSASKNILLDQFEEFVRQNIYKYVSK